MDLAIEKAKSVGIGWISTRGIIKCIIIHDINLII